MIDVGADPFQAFGRWWAAAQASGAPLPEAMTLATATRDGRPSARMVLLRGIDPRGFTFYTNYLSRKARELDDNPHAALVLHWAELGRQVRIEGSVERVSTEESAAYFATRPEGSQLAAWASPQSLEIAGREVLEARVSELAAEYRGGPVPLPPFWGGYRVVPDRIEFWLSRESRLHDRVAFVREPGEPAGWQRVILAP